MFVGDCTVHPLKVKTEDEYTQEISGPTKYYSKLLCPAIGRQYLRDLREHNNVLQDVLNLTNMQHLQSLKKLSWEIILSKII